MKAMRLLRNNLRINQLGKVNMQKEAIECIKEILESYTEFLEYMHKTDNLQQIRIVGNFSYSKWKPLLEKIKEDIKTQ